LLATTYPLTVTDQHNQEVGIATDPFGGLVLRQVGGDNVMFQASPTGPNTGPIDFYHLAVDCTDSRYLPISGGAGFAYFAQVHQGAVFYTKTQDPTMTPVAYHAYEHFTATQDATVPGVCLPFEGSLALGVVTTGSDPALAALTLPLRLR
jgi:hypothetical protein